MSWHMSPRYGNVILVSGYRVLTAVSWPYQEGVINSWARQRGCPMCLAIVTSQQSKACDEQNFRKWRCYCFSCEHLSLFFPVNEAAMWFFFWSRIPLPYIPTEEVSVFWLLRENSAKKVSEAFWWVSKLGKLCECGATFRSTKTRFSLDKKAWENL